MKNQKFEIVLEDFELSKNEVANLEKELHSVVAKHLVGAQHRSTPIGKKTMKNPEWLGIWLKKFRTDLLINKAKTFKVADIQAIGR